MSLIQKYQLQGAPVQIVLSLGGAFLLFWILSWLLPLLGSVGLYPLFIEKLSLPWNPLSFLWQPWSLFTAPWFVYSNNILNFIIRLVIIYQFGNLILTLRKNSTVWFLFLMGGVTAYAVQVVLSSIFLPFWILDGFSSGSGPAVLTLAAAAGTLMPEMNIQLFLLGNVRLKWIVIVFIIWDIIALGVPSYVSLTHIGGALFGFFYALQYKKGIDWESIVYSKLAFRNSNPFKPTRFTSTRAAKVNPRKGRVSEEELDELLDKVARKGYASLSRQEKERLEQASRQDL
jgi:hypothetical protein